MLKSKIKKVKVIIAIDYNETPIILDIPPEDFDITMLDSNYLEDEQFTNLEMLPKEVGIYELECDLYYDNSYDALEQTNKDIEFKIVKVTELYKV